MKEKLKLHPTEYCPKDLTNQTKKMMEHKIKWTIFKVVVVFTDRSQS